MRTANDNESVDHFFALSLGAGYVSVKLFYRFIILLALLTSLHGCAAYSTKEIRGNVVDAETGAPLPGVVIVAQWLLDSKYVGENNALLKVMETVTDKEGKYVFPAWGPIVLPPLADFRAGDDPLVLYFKLGYERASESNEYVSRIAYRATPLGGFRANGKTIRLKRCGECNDAQYWSRLDTFSGLLPGPIIGASWKEYPKMTWAIEQENRRYMASGTHVFGIHPEGFIFENLSAEDREYLARNSDFGKTEESRQAVDTKMKIQLGPPVLQSCKGAAIIDDGHTPVRSSAPPSKK